MPSALEDVVIADFTQMMQGGWASQKLGDLGADIIKIEPPTGEHLRQLPSGGGYYRGEAIKYLVMNRNKRSIAIDLKTDRGHQIARRIIKEADIVMENFRPGVMDSLDLGYESVKKFKPNIIYVTGTGYGHDGPAADRPGQDLLIQAKSGLVSITGRSQDPPTPCGTYIADQMAANLTAFHTISALYYKQRTGEGQLIRVNLLDALIDAMCQEYATAANQGINYERGTENHGNVVAGAPYGIYEAADGYLAISLASLHDIGKILDISFDEFNDSEEIYAHKDEIHAKIEQETQIYPVDELVETMREQDLWVGKVQDLETIESQAQVNHNNILIDVEHPQGGTYRMPGFPVKMSETPGSVRYRPPHLGEHTEEILIEYGYDRAEIEAVIQDEIVISHKKPTTAGE